jgi:DNA polymerase-3 subunit delta
MYHGLKDKGRINVSKALGINPYAVKDIERAAKSYPMRKVAQVISNLREADLQSKGVNAGQSTHGDILKQLLFKILH